LQALLASAKDFSVRGSAAAMWVEDKEEELVAGAGEK
jgi:hypothetical protein